MNLLKCLFERFPMRGSVVVTKLKVSTELFTTDDIDSIHQKYDVTKDDYYYHPVTHKTDEVSFPGRGKNDTAEQFTCLWADLDISTKNAEKYPSPQQMEGFLDELKRIGLTPSCLVHSGAGFHAYWFLDKPYECKDYQSVVKSWQKYLSRILNELYPDDELTIDPTGDMARILRLPGTRHSSAGLAVREVWCDSNIWYYLDSLSSMSEYNNKSERGHGKKGIQSRMLQNMGQLHTNTPSYSRNIIKSCKQMENFVMERGAIPEPAWYTMAGLFSYTEDGEELFISVSQAADGVMDTNRSADAAIAKMEQWRNSTDGPPICKIIDEKYPGICEACPKWNMITTPLQLGYSAPVKIEYPDTQPIGLGGIDFVQERRVENFTPPYPYILNDKEELCIEVETTNSGEGKKIIVITPNMIVPVKRIWHEQDMQEVVYFNIYTSKDGYRECVIPMSNLPDMKFVKDLSRSGAVIEPAGKQFLSGYMNKCITYMQRERKVNQSYSRIGWRGKDPLETSVDSDDRFVLGDMVFYEHDKNHRETLTDSLKDVVMDIGMKGSLDEWRKACSVLGREGMEPHQMVFFGAFAAPLLRATDYTGMLINLVSKDSGTFKSFALKMASSIYGIPKFDHLVQKDTMNAAIRKIACRSDLPVTFDECTNIGDEDLSDFLYTLTQGREKDRLDMNADLRRNIMRWNSFVLGSSNSSLDDILGHERMAERMRLFEMSVQHCFKKPPMTPVEASQAMKSLDGNYGIAGAAWINHLTLNKNDIFARANSVVEDLSSRLNAGGDKRFWISFVALSLFAAEETKKLGLHDFDLEKLVSYCKEQFYLSDDKVQSDKLPLPLLMSSFINDNLSSVLQITYTTNLRGGEITHEARNKLKALIEIKHTGVSTVESTAFINNRSMKEYLKSQRISYADFIREMHENMLLGSVNLQKRIPLSGGKTGTTVMRCFSVNLNRFTQLYGDPNELVK